MSQSPSDGIAGRGADTRGSGLANGALALSLSAVAVWVVALAADELYLLMVVLAVAGLVLGARARSAHGPQAPGSGRALAAIMIGGALTALFLAFLVVAIANGDM